MDKTEVLKHLDLIAEDLRRFHNQRLAWHDWGNSMWQAEAKRVMSDASRVLKELSECVK